MCMYMYDVCMYVSTHTHSQTHTRTHTHTQEWQPARRMGEAPGESRRESQRTVSSRATGGYPPQQTATKLDIGDLEVCIFIKLTPNPNH